MTMQVKQSEGLLPDTSTSSSLLPPPQTFSSLFEDLTHTMSVVKKQLADQEGDPWKELKNRMEHVPNIEIHASQLCSALEKGNWKDPIFEDPYYIYYGLYSVKDKKISAEQFSTLMFYWSLHQHHTKEEIRIIPLFKGEEINEEAWDIISKTLAVPKNSVKFSSEEKSFLDSEKLKQFFELMKQKPASERYFFVIPDLNPIPFADMATTEEYNETVGKVRELMAQKNWTISQEIYFNTGINIFSRFKHNEKNMRMIASLAMQQTYLDVKYKHPIKIHPVIGVSQIKDITQNGLQHTRDLALPFEVMDSHTAKKQVDLPKEADSFKADLSYDFFYHDFYHALIASAVPDLHQKAFVELSLNLKEMATECLSEQENEKIAFSAIKSAFLDMEHIYYQNVNDLDVSEIFFASLAQSVLKALAHFTLKKTKKNPHELKDSKIIEKYHETFFSSLSLVIPKIAKSIIHNKKHLKTAYGISFKSLELQAVVARTALKKQENALASHLLVQLDHFNQLSKQRNKKPAPQESESIIYDFNSDEDVSSTTISFSVNFDSNEFSWDHRDFGDDSESQDDE